MLCLIRFFYVNELVFCLLALENPAFTIHVAGLGWLKGGKRRLASVPGELLDITVCYPERCFSFPFSSFFCHRRKKNIWHPFNSAEKKLLINNSRANTSIGRTFRRRSFFFSTSSSVVLFLILKRTSWTMDPMHPSNAGRGRGQRQGESAGRSLAGCPSPRI